jgi:hypothetical protein
MKICSKCKKEKNAAEFTKTSSMCPICRKEYNKEWRENNRARSNSYQSGTKEQRRLKANEYRQKNKETINRRAKQRRLELGKPVKIKKILTEEELQKRRKAQHEYRRNKAARNDAFQLEIRLRCKIHQRLLRGLAGQKKDPFIPLLECNFAEYKEHMESQFKEGMTWDNWGDKWQIDHVIMPRHFDLTKESHQKAFFHYTNTRPLWNKDNWSKQKNL